MKPKLPTMYDPLNIVFTAKGTKYDIVLPTACTGAVPMYLWELSKNYGVAHGNITAMVISLHRNNYSVFPCDVRIQPNCVLIVQFSNG